MKQALARVSPSGVAGTPVLFSWSSDPGLRAGAEGSGHDPATRGLALGLSHGHLPQLPRCPWEPAMLHPRLKISPEAWSLDFSQERRGQSGYKGPCPGTPGSLNPQFLQGSLRKCPERKPLHTGVAPGTAEVGAGVSLKTPVFFPPWHSGSPSTQWASRKGSRALSATGIQAPPVPTLSATPCSEDWSPFRLFLSQPPNLGTQTRVARCGGHLGQG